MRSIISLLDKKENISNEISRLQKRRQTISKQVKDYVKNLSPEKKRFLDDKILSTFSEEKLKQIEAYRKYMKDLSTGVCNCYQAWNNIFDPYTDKYTIEKVEKVIVKNKVYEGLFIRVTVTPENPSNSISDLVNFYDFYMTDWFDIDEFEKCN